MYLLTLKAADYLHRIKAVESLPPRERQAVVGKTVQILDALPDLPDRGALLVAGVRPGLTALVIEQFRKAAVTCLSLSHAIKTSREVFSCGDERREVESLAIPVERERFPFPDDYFSAVVIADLLEYLPGNPVRPLWEAHRVLKKDGTLVLVVENALRHENILAVCEGRNIFGSYGEGRKFRQFTVDEIMTLMACINFTGITAHTVTSAPVEGKIRRERGRAADLLRLLFPSRGDAHSLDDLIIARAQPAEPRRYVFPSALFGDSPLRSDYFASFIHIGENDMWQLGDGWAAPSSRFFRLTAALAADLTMRRASSEREVQLIIAPAKGSCPLTVKVFIHEALLGTEKFPSEERRALRFFLPGGEDPLVHLTLRIEGKGAVELYSADLVSSGE